MEVHTTGISDGLTEVAIHSSTTFATCVRNGSDKRKYNEKVFAAWASRENRACNI